MLISFTNALGETFDIQDNYMLQPSWDLGNAPVKHQSSKAPYQDGETYIDTIFEPGNPVIEFAITGVNRQELFDRRAIVIRYFNPKLGMGTLKVVQDDGITTKWIDCIPSQPIFPSGDGRSNNHQMIIIAFFAPNPFWYDPAQLQSIMIGFSGGFSFPFSFPFNLGTVGSEIEVVNSGNIETPVMIYFYGEVTDPVISNLTTGEDITIVHTVADGDILIINTAFGEKAALILTGGVYVNAFEYVSPDSVFWKLAPGINAVKYTVTSQGANANCLLYYYNLFSGI